MKHLEVGQLRAQEKVREGRATVSWISRCRNAADALRRGGKHALDPPHRESRSRVSWADLTDPEDVE